MITRADIHRRLICRIDRLCINFQSRTVTLYLPQGDCTDMRGAIDVATALYSDVRNIDTVSGYAPDTRYVKNLESGEWRAVWGRSHVHQHFTFKETKV